MNLHAITLVQASLERVMQQGETVVALFYAHLFMLDPALRTLFPPDLSEHGRSFLAALQLGVNGLLASETMIPAIKQIGYLHARHGIGPRHYHTFGQAWLWTLAQVLGDTFTEEVAEAWQEAFYLVAGLMKEAAIN
ncbi:MAG: hypothetical protein KC413_12975 [Anaerolineales bacterium]|nr:hypothetical protein [Anaerolineales bacterium]MCA9976665.1 hypothetical protein [Anaerolineales bacterium]MCB8965885.1 hemin receptor [Ardenticatenaceae bacterium]